MYILKPFGNSIYVGDMEIKLTNCKLRSWNINDVSSLVKHANNSHIADFLRDIFPFPYTRNDAEFFIQHIITNPANLVLAIDFNGEAIGSIGVHFQNDVYRYNAELGYWLSEMYWRKGIVSECVNALVKYTFENYDTKRIYACVFENNIASIKVLEKCGFIREAIFKNAVSKKGIIMDEYVYALLHSK